MAWTEAQKQLLAELDQFGHIVAKHDDRLTAAVTELASVKNEAKALGSTLEGLSRIVREGNGQSSLVTRMVLLEERLAALREQLKAERDRRWQLRLALAASFLMPMAVGLLLWSIRGK